MEATKKLRLEKSFNAISMWTKTRAVLLDAGGGSGSTLVWLPSLGYEVHLDRVPKHIEQALSRSTRQ
jgi:hypothetical protein